MAIRGTKKKKWKAFHAAAFLHEAAAAAAQLDLWATIVHWPPIALSRLRGHRIIPLYFVLDEH
jgi:hypothetical protein